MMKIKPRATSIGLLKMVFEHTGAHVYHATKNDNNFYESIDDEPCIIMHDGLTTISMWGVNGVLHREHNPALIRQYNDGTINHVLYSKNGFEHNTNGPCIISDEGNVEWAIDGVKFSISEYMKVNNTLTDDEKIELVLKYG